MCVFGSGGQQYPDPQMPKEYAAQRMPDGSAVKTASGRRASDRVRSGSNTILTSGSGVTQLAPTEKKTLLGA